MFMQSRPRTIFLLATVLVMGSVFLVACGSNSDAPANRPGSASGTSQTLSEAPSPPPPSVPSPAPATPSGSPSGTSPVSVEPFSPEALGVPAAAWSRGIGVPYDQPGHPYEGSTKIDDGPWAGVPLGGLGAGSIGRTYRGDFARWHLDIGAHRFESLPANQFSVFVAQDGRKQAHVLSPLRPAILQGWNWDMPVGAGTYYALFPKAWYLYHWDTLPLRLAQKQFSPVIPENYRESSYPVGVFEWLVENPSDKPLTVGLMFTWQTLVGHQWGKDLNGGNYNYVVKQGGVVGVVLTHTSERVGAVTEEWDGSFAIATPEQPGLSVTYRTRFPLPDGSAVWTDFAADGRLDNVDDQTPAKQGEVIGGALAAFVELAPGERRTIPFALAWDFPITEFGAGTQWYKRYTAFYGTTGRNAWALVADALAQYPAWEAQIDQWQRPILGDVSRPDWYKTALFNELYVLIDGGTFWENGRVGGAPPADGLGSFAYLESADYTYYNTFDVDFYASFALAELWPEIEKRIVRDFAATVPLSDPEIVTIGATGERVPRKAAGAVPHDLGDPGQDPLRQLNAYTFQNINIWKDLNSKFVLRVWRDYVFTGDSTLVHSCWPAVVQALEYLHQFDRDGDGLPDHDGVPDQTYDNWVMTGASAYGGSLWLAALEAAIAMGDLEGDTAHVTRYATWLGMGRASFEGKLWNGRYYDFDASGDPYADTIMADQLAGQWYADATGLLPIVPINHIALTLQTIYDRNVRGFEAGSMGAVNGVRPDGSLDTSNLQASEVWTGVSYALAAFMLHRGLTDEGWATAWGVYNVTYNRGYWFRTPEAWDKRGNFRASMYMRPLSIWAIERALRTRMP